MLASHRRPPGPERSSPLGPRAKPLTSGGPQPALHRLSLFSFFLRRITLTASGAAPPRRTDKEWEVSRHGHPVLRSILRSTIRYSILVVLRILVLMLLLRCRRLAGQRLSINHSAYGVWTEQPANNRPHNSPSTALSSARLSLSIFRGVGPPCASVGLRVTPQSIFSLRSTAYAPFTLRGWGLLLMQGG